MAQVERLGRMIAGMIKAARLVGSLKEAKEALEEKQQ